MAVNLQGINLFPIFAETNIKYANDIYHFRTSILFLLERS